MITPPAPREPAPPHRPDPRSCEEPPPPLLPRSRNPSKLWLNLALPCWEVAGAQARIPPRDGAGSAEISPVGYTSLKLLVFAKEPQ